MWLTVFASAFDCSAVMSIYGFIVDLIKGGFSVVLEQDAISYSEAAVICPNSCIPVFPTDYSMYAGL